MASVIYFVVSAVTVLYVQCISKHLCNAECPPHKPYYTDAGCVYKCPKDFHINGSSCIVTCGDWFTNKNRECQLVCPDSYFVREVVRAVGLDSYLEKQCVASCDSTEFIFNGTCVEACPTDLSYRQLKRHCKSLGLKRRSNWDTAVIQAAILAEVQGTGRNLGCRAMASKLRTKYGLNVGREKVLEYQNLIDPEGVQARLSNRLSRREYFNKGPNYLIHIDGYDKIKKYGFGIHGAICGFSRRILWLRVAHSNNNPNIIAAYFLDFVRILKGAPRCIRMDAGTENVVVADMQKALRWFHGDSTSGERSVIVGSSHTNQRIECWWRQLHQRSIAAWKDKFCQMEEQGVFSTADNIHILCVRFCFMKLIQEELDMVREEWNTHYIRRQTREGSPCGKPDMLYLHPELYGTYDYKFPVHDADCEALSTYCDIPHVNGIEEELEATLLQLMHLHGKHMPETSAEANDLLLWLTSKLQ